MAKNNKVAWMESQYLYPHHFQQQERYFETRLEQRSAAINPYVWGVSLLTIDNSQLIEGRIAISETKGIMPDGCPFELPHQAPLPAPAQVPKHIKNQLVYLVLPNYQSGSRYVETSTNTDSIARYRLQEIEIFDYCSDNSNVERIESASLQFRIALDSEDLGGFSCLPIARIIEVTQEGAILLDKKYVPPCLQLSANRHLQGYLNEVIGLLKQRGEALSHRFVAAGQEGGSSAIADFMLLQLINRHEPRLQHFDRLKGLHPETLYVELLGLMGELATFTTAQKRPLDTIAYDHEDLYSCFHPVMNNLGKHLSAVLEQSAISLPVEARQFGIFVSPISDRSLLTQARFVLAVNADMPIEELRSHLVNHIKIGSVESIRDLVNNQLPGVAIASMPVAPREIPYHAGFLYFELDRRGEQWKSLNTSGGFSFHISGDFPKLNIEFWAIRD
jgi:type VI secretion system protein ImpJ